MIDHNKLKGAAVAHGYTMRAIADKLEITPETLRRNIKSGGLGVRYIDAIRQLLHLSDTETLEIFLSQQRLDI